MLISRIRPETIWPCRQAAGESTIVPQDSYQGTAAPPLQIMPPPHRLLRPPSRPRPRRLAVEPQGQSIGVSCGQCAVAMTLTYLTGKKWTDHDVNARYGFELQRALETETRDRGLAWKLKAFSSKSWRLIEEKLRLGRPVVMGLNGPQFSRTGRGHIITLVAVEGDRVYFCDPALNQRRCLRKSDFDQAPPYPGGNFYFCPKKVRNGSSDRRPAGRNSL